ncbi:hypothetical protein CH282_01515 [Rhodococcus sp. 06-418-1B]|nr:hypothetical protein [Rhodococcus sp. 06-418-1B]OZC92971.1 hypothetical protein CH282_01515 [Rhodococcus sp. 06-418-1B]
MAAYIAEQCGTTAIHTGASLGNQPATLLGVGLTQVVLVSLQAAGGGGTGFMLTVTAISADFILASKESEDRDLTTFEHLITKARPETLRSASR